MRSEAFGLSVIALLAGCGGVGSGGDASEPSLFFGTEDWSASSNSLEFADGTQFLTEMDGQTLTVKVVRYLTDYATGETRLVIADETLTIDPFDDAGFDELTMTIGDETLIFSDGSAVDSNGRVWTAFRNNSFAFSGTRGLYSYAYGGDEDAVGAVDTEAYFAVGFETNPATIASLVSNPTFDGQWSGFGALIDDTGALLESEVEGDGTITLIADFASGTVGGSLAGAYGSLDVGGTIVTTDIIGNGYVSDLSLEACATGSTCTTSSQLAGVFYGSGADETSGIIGFDITSTDDTTGESTRLLSGAGYAALNY